MGRRDSFEVLRRAIAVLGDAAAIVIGLLFAIWLRFESGWLPPASAPPAEVLYFGATVIFTALSVLIFAAQGLYQRSRVGSFLDQVPVLIRALFWSFILGIVLAFLVRAEPSLSRLTVLLAIFTVTGAVVTQRWVLFRTEVFLARRGGRSNAILMLGAGETAARLRDAIESDPLLRCKVISFLRVTDESNDARIEQDRISGSLDEFEYWLGQLAPDHVVLSRTDIGTDRMLELIAACEQAMVRFHVVPDLLPIQPRNFEMRHFKGIPLLGLSGGPLDDPFNRLLKRVEDLIGAAVGLLVAVPVIALLAPLIKLSSPGPVFYMQERYGWKGRPFIMYKLRSMVVEAEEEGGPAWSAGDDCRCTRVGAFMRRYSLDELPQFWNVVKGDMSLVGPRPERPVFVESFRYQIRGYMRRHGYRPGITGWAQVNGLRGDTSLDDRIRYDLWYLENWSLLLDFKILLRTLFVSLRLN